MKFWVQHDQGGMIGLAFGLADRFFLVVQVLGVVIKRVVIYTYVRTSKASLLVRAFADK